MSARLAPSDLDEILALQFTVAWAGEAAGEPARLGWWKSDLVDPEAGGDLFARLVPKTAEWASLGLVREAARAVDEAGRAKLAQGDRVWTLFHFGFAVDEQLQDRIAHHRQLLEPSGVLGPRFLAHGAWDRQALETMLQGLGKPKVEVTPGGRLLKSAAASPLEAAQLLASALLPFGAAYPLPYLEVRS